MKRFPPLVSSPHLLERTQKMAPTTTADRLRARWAKQGGGPELEQRLLAAKEELARREKVAKVVVWFTVFFVDKPDDR